MAGFLETLLPGQGAGNLLQSLVSNQSLGDRVGSRAAGLVATQTHTPEPRTEAAASPVVAAWKNAKAASCPRVAAVYLPCVWNTLPAKALVAGHRALLRAWRLLPQDSPPCLGPRIDRRPQSPTPHVGKGNRARHRRMNSTWPERDSVDAGLLLVSLAFPSPGPRTSMAGVACLTSYPMVTLVEGSFLGVKVDAIEATSRTSS